jgi:hypothetical protein
MWEMNGKCGREISAARVESMAGRCVLWSALLVVHGGGIGISAPYASP